MCEKESDNSKCDQINKQAGQAERHRIHLMTLPPLAPRAAFDSTLRLLTIKNFNFVFVIPLVCCVASHSPPCPSQSIASDERRGVLRQRKIPSSNRLRRVDINF